MRGLKWSAKVTCDKSWENDIKGLLRIVRSSKSFVQRLTHDDPIRAEKIFLAA